MLQQDYFFLDKDSRAKPFFQARQLCAQLGLSPLESAQYIYHAMGQTKQIVTPGLSDFSAPAI